jgi:protoheme IX farnesyltransferase
MSDMSVNQLSIDEAHSVQAAQPGDYIALMKPRVMSLVVFTAFVGMVCAPATMNPLLAFIAIAAIAIGAGASGALNMAYDADIDAVMTRTQKRPVPRGVIPRAEATTLGLILSVFAVMTLWLASNLLAAALLAFTIAFYAIVYTMWLKRSTAQNIVIGGLAGALPPAVAWAATGAPLDINAWLLVAIIFFWTPPHFWALALYKAGDYGRAGVPMLPNVAGPKTTRRHIFAYALLVALLGFAPVLTGLGGPVYAVVSAVLGLGFVFLSWRVLTSRAGEGDAEHDPTLYTVIAAGNRHARNLFAFSILYLFALYAALLLEQLAVGVMI